MLRPLQRGRHEPLAHRNRFRGNRGRRSLHLRGLQPRAAKPLNANGVLVEFAKKLTPTQADWFMRHFVKPHFAKIEALIAPYPSFDAEIQQGIKEALEGKPAQA